jgi:hypothetical protein
MLVPNSGGDVVSDSVHSPHLTYTQWDSTAVPPSLPQLTLVPSVQVPDVCSCRSNTRGCWSNTRGCRVVGHCCSARRQSPRRHQSQGTYHAWRGVGPIQVDTQLHAATSCVRLTGRPPPEADVLLCCTLSAISRAPLPIILLLSPPGERGLCPSSSSSWVSPAGCRGRLVWEGFGRTTGISNAVGCATAGRGPRHHGVGSPVGKAGQARAGKRCNKPSDVCTAGYVHDGSASLAPVRGGLPLCADVNWWLQYGCC